MMMSSSSVLAAKNTSPVKGQEETNMGNMCWTHPSR